MNEMWRTILRGSLFVSALCVAATSALAGQQPGYRQRLLGVFNANTGDPVDGASVIDMALRNSSLTTATGTVTLVFLPEGESVVKIQKIGYSPLLLTVSISPADTVPLTVLLHPLAQTLAAMVTRDSAHQFKGPGLQAFEDRLRQHNGGHFITEAELRKSDNRSMTNVLRSLPGIRIDCARSSSLTSKHKVGDCWAVASRTPSKYAIIGGPCEVDIYLDGVQVDENNLEKFRVNEYAGVEFYAGGASLPPQYNKTGASCGVLLFWSRER